MRLCLRINGGDGGLKIPRCSPGQQTEHTVLRKKVSWIQFKKNVLIPDSYLIMKEGHLLFAAKCSIPSMSLCWREQFYLHSSVWQDID